MRLYCHACGKVTHFNSLLPTAISCEKCNHEQPIKTMATRKTGSVTGASLDRKTGKGKLTGSKRFEAPDPTEDSGGTTQTTTRTPVTTSRSSSSGSSSGSSGGYGGGGKLTTGNSATSYQRAIEIASKYGGVQPLDIGNLLGSNPYAADGDIPEMGAKEANTAKLRMQRQQNAISVRHEKAKLGRAVVKAAIEEVSLIGDLVDYATAEITTASEEGRRQRAEGRRMQYSVGF